MPDWIRKRKLWKLGKRYYDPVIPVGTTANLSSQDKHCRARWHVLDFWAWTGIKRVSAGSGTCDLEYLRVDRSQSLVRVSTFPDKLFPSPRVETPELTSAALGTSEYSSMLFLLCQGQQHWSQKQVLAWDFAKSDVLSLEKCMLDMCEHYILPMQSFMSIVPGRCRQMRALYWVAFWWLKYWCNYFRQWKRWGRRKPSTGDYPQSWIIESLWWPQKLSHTTLLCNVAWHRIDDNHVLACSAVYSVEGSSQEFSHKNCRTQYPFCATKLTSLTVNDSSHLFFSLSLIVSAITS